MEKKTLKCLYKGVFHATTARYVFQSEGGGDRPRQKTPAELIAQAEQMEKNTPEALRAEAARIMAEERAARERKQEDRLHAEGLRARQEALADLAKVVDGVSGAAGAVRAVGEKASEALSGVGEKAKEWAKGAVEQNQREQEQRDYNADARLNEAKADLRAARKALATWEKADNAKRGTLPDHAGLVEWLKHATAEYKDAEADVKRLDTRKKLSEEADALVRHDEDMLKHNYEVAQAKKEAAEAKADAAAMAWNKKNVPKGAVKLFTDAASLTPQELLAEVKQVQEFYRKRGHPDLKVDGKLGLQTLALIGSPTALKIRQTMIAARNANADKTRNVAASGSAAAEKLPTEGITGRGVGTETILRGRAPTRFTPNE